jgi:hypothetical protein
MSWNLEKIVAIALWQILPINVKHIIFTAADHVNFNPLPNVQLEIVALRNMLNYLTTRRAMRI